MELLIENENERLLYAKVEEDPEGDIEFISRLFDITNKETEQVMVAKKFDLNRTMIAIHKKYSLSVSNIRFLVI